MLKSLRIRNFKCIRDSRKIILKPITILVGPNSSGKSSFIKFLLLLKQTIESKNYSSPVTNIGPRINLGTYEEFIFKSNLNRNLIFELSLEEKPIYKKKYNLRFANKVKVKTEMSYSKRKSQITLKSSEISTEKDSYVEKIHRTRRHNYELRISKMDDNYILNESKKENVIPMNFYDYYSIEEKSIDYLSLKHISIVSLIQKSLRNIFYIGPLRNYPQRIYISSGQPVDVGSKGESAIDALFYSHSSFVKGKKYLEKRTEYWLRRFDMAKTISLEKLKPGNYFILNLKDPYNGTEVNLADVGFGTSQTIPIIIQSILAPKDSITLIEQPEIHLHPKAQSLLGDLFIAAIRDENKCFIIETHSENLLARIRRRIVEEEISRNDVAIYYFQPRNNGTKIMEIKLNAFGQYTSFPKEFFEEEVIELQKFFSAIRNKKMKK